MKTEAKEQPMHRWKVWKDQNVAAKLFSTDILAEPLLMEPKQVLEPAR